MLFLEAHRSLHSINSVLRGLMELQLHGSSHQPAGERRAAEILRARSVPHRTMGAAILERTKWNAGPGGGAGTEPASAGSGRTPLGGPPARVPRMVRPGREQHGYGVSALGTPAGAASFAASRGDRLRLRLLPRHSRRYPRPHARTEGGWQRRGRETAAACLFGEGWCALSPWLHAGAARLAWGCEPLRSLPGKQRVWTRKGPSCSLRTFLTRRVSFSARFLVRSLKEGNPNRACSL